jgi:hypothetical protein
MMRRWLPGVVLILAGCTMSGNPPPPPGTAQAFFTGPDTIQVTASDYSPARAVTLVNPSGEVAAVSIDTTSSSGYAAAPSGSSLSFGLGAGGGGSFGGIGLGFPLVGGGAPAYTAAAISAALIRVPAVPPYAQIWHDSQIRIQFGDPPNVKYISIPAPPPPQV